MNIKIMQTQRVLSQTQITLADYVINPYRGCEFGCFYCYSQTNKNIKRDGFHDNVYVKINAPLVLEKELKTIRPKRVLLGSTTECFLYQETQYKITDKILKILNKNNIPYTILTKSHLITASIPEIAKNRQNKVYFTFNFHSDAIISLLEPKAPGLNLRLKALDELIKAGVDTRVHIGPFMPFVSNLDEIISKIPPGIKEVDVELYNKKQGSFEKIIESLKDYLQEEEVLNLKKIYENEENYNAYIQTLKNQIKNLGTDHVFFLIASGFNAYYNDSIDYNKSLSP
jgi:DNA repair photolyase